MISRAIMKWRIGYLSAEAAAQRAVCDDLRLTMEQYKTSYYTDQWLRERQKLHAMEAKLTRLKRQLKTLLLVPRMIEKSGTG
jgi:cell shape-determining protein MreC